MPIHNPTSLTAQPTSSRRIRQTRDLAERIISYETRENNSSATKTPAAFPVSEKLRWHLANLMGTTGFRALLARALERADVKVPSLRVVQVKADGSLEGVDKLEAQVNPEEFAQSRVVLLAELLGLLTVFIGENLTLQLVCEVWPRLSLNDLDVAEGDGNENAK